MGYISRIGKISKIDSEKYKNKTYEEVCEMIGDKYLPVYPPDHTQLFSLGSHYGYENNMEPFYCFDVSEYIDCEFHIMEKQDLKNIIFDYHEKIFGLYNDLISGEHSIESFLEERKNVWYIKKDFNFYPYRLDEKRSVDGEIVRSWDYEYAIFNLVYIYRTFDWDNDYLIYSAW